MIDSRKFFKRKLFLFLLTRYSKMSRFQHLFLQSIESHLNVMVMISKIYDEFDLFIEILNVLSSLLFYCVFDCLACIDSSRS